MMNCIAIDDEPKALEVIERYCGKVDSIELLSVFREPLKAIEFLSRAKVDLIFLDINMPDVNGLQLFSALPEKPMVIFTTAYSDYAVESYDLRAIDYLLKPITFERFLSSANKAVELFILKNKKPATPEFVLIKSGPQTHKVKVDDILYMEKEGNYLTVFTKDKKILIRENMTEVFDIIPEEGFVRVHKSFIVSLKHISSFEIHQVTVGNNKIPIGSSYGEELKKQLGLKF
jgi:DNA-binding LytR/AlgR family response regulator